MPVRSGCMNLLCATSRQMLIVIGVVCNLFILNPLFVSGYAQNTDRETDFKKLIRHERLWRSGLTEDAHPGVDYPHSESVVKKYHSFLEKYPDHNGARRRLIGISLQRNDIDEACAQWEEILASGPDNDMLINECGIFFSDEVYRPLKAAKLFKRAIAIDDSVADYHANLGLIYFVGRHLIADQYGWTLPEMFERMLRQYDIARRLEPAKFVHARDYAQNFIMADMFEVNVESDRAIDAWRFCLQAPDATPNQLAYVCIQMARIYYQLGDVPSATKHLKKALHYDTTNTTAQKMLDDLETKESR